MMPQHADTAAHRSPKEGKKSASKKKNRPRQDAGLVNVPPNPPLVPLPKNPQLSIPGGERKGAGRSYAAKERAKADAIFASTSSHWYAGAAFDRSPAANTLPKPTKLLSRSPARAFPQPIESDGDTTFKDKARLASSCPSSSHLYMREEAFPGTIPHGPIARDRERQEQFQRGSKTEQGSPPTSSQVSISSEDLKAKSKDLLKMLRSSQANGATPVPFDPAIARATPRRPPPSPEQGVGKSDELDEMTRQVRKLLNIS